MLKIKTIILFLIISTTLSGCASSTFMYDRVDWLARVYLERYVKLDSEQRGLLKANLQSLKEWHRDDELINYLKFLDRLQNDIQHDLTAATVKVWYVEAGRAFEAIRNESLPYLVDVADTLSDAQVEQFLTKLEDQNKKYDKKYLSRSEDEYKDSLNERMEDRIKYWLGKLTPDQIKIIESMTQEFERLDSEWMSERRLFHQSLAEVLEKDSGWQVRLINLIKNRTEYSRNEDLASNQRNEQRVFSAIAEILAIRTDKQDIALNKRIDKWKKNISSMMDASSQPEAT